MKKMLVISVMVFLLGCNDKGPYEMFTKIRDDGTCYREFIKSADSTFASGDTSANPFPVKIDSTWKINIYKRMTGDTSRFKNYPAGKIYKENGLEYSYIATAKKEYLSVDEMSESFRYNNSEWDSIHPLINLKMKFRWFYTYYEYTETFKSANPFKRVPVSEYLTEAEVATLYGESTELYKGKNGFENKEMLSNLEKKSEEWISHNFYEEVYSQCLENFDLFESPYLDSATFAAEKDSIFRYCQKQDADILNNDLIKIFDMHFKTKVFSQNSDTLDKILEKNLYNFFGNSGLELNYKLSMPGKIIETNAPFLRNDTLTWRVENNRFFLNDYALMAVSRKPNLWAFIVTGVIILLAISGFLLKRSERE